MIEFIWKDRDMHDFLLSTLQIKSMSFFEAGMLICFGASWPFAVRKTFRTKSVKGKSKLFLSLIILGYVFGIIHKVLFSMDIVVWLYVINLLLVGADLSLCIKYSLNGVQNEIK